MSQADPPWQGERETGILRFFSTLEAASNGRGRSTHCGAVGLRQAEVQEATSHPDQDDGKHWVSLLRRYWILESNPQPRRGFSARYGWPLVASW